MSFKKCWKNKYRCSEPAKISLRSVDYRKISSTQVKELIENEILAAGIARDQIANEWNAYDSEYLAWPAEIIHKVFALCPERYSHAEFLSDIFDQPSQGSDCDNSAGWRKQWFYNYLPGAAVVGITGYHDKGGHRFVGVVSTEGHIVWFGGNLEKYKRFSDIVW